MVLFTNILNINNLVFSILSFFIASLPPQCEDRHHPQCIQENGLDQPLATRGQGYQAHQLSCPVVICELIHVDVHRGKTACGRESSRQVSLGYLTDHLKYYI